MELLPCPFCGGTSVTVEEGTTYRWAVATCVDCGATASEVRAVPDVVKTQELALAEWNRRASPASVPAVTDGMALAFHRALTDGSIGQPEVDEIKTGLRAALAAAPTPPVSEDRWQPIETAPKDDSHVLLAGKRREDIASGYWLQSAYAGNGAWIWPFVHKSPIHWMPLPKAPTMQEDKP